MPQILNFLDGFLDTIYSSYKNEFESNRVIEIGVPENVFDAIESDLKAIGSSGIFPENKRELDLRYANFTFKFTSIINNQ